MTIIDKLKNLIEKDQNKKKLNDLKENAKNNLTPENRNNIRYLFASFFGLAAIMAFSVSFYKLFMAYVLVGISILPFMYHNSLTYNFNINKIRVFEVIVPIIVFLIVIIL